MFETCTVLCFALDHLVNKGADDWIILRSLRGSLIERAVCSIPLALLTRYQAKHVFQLETTADKLTVKVSPPDSDAQKLTAGAHDLRTADERE